MRKLMLIAALVFLPASALAHFGPYGLRGNDIGGIIPWSPEVHLIYREIAAAHCASYNKFARITSVHARYGDYVGFECRFPRGYDPVKAAVYGVVVVERVVRAKN